MTVIWDIEGMTNRGNGGYASRYRTAPVFNENTHVSRKLIMICCAWTILLCLAAIPVFLGYGAISFRDSPVPTFVWITLVFATLVLVAIAVSGRSKGDSG